MATDYEQLAEQIAAKWKINPTYFRNQIRQESSFNPTAGSPAGAQGIAQIMPGTAKAWGVNPLDPVAALNAAAKHMSGYLNSYKGDWAKALAAYNAGPGAVQKYGGVPPYKETQNYVKAILGGHDAVQPSPVMGAQATAVASAAPMSANKTDLLEFIFKNSPFAGMATQQAEAQAAAPADTPTPAAAPSAPAGKIGKDYHWLQHEGETLFGLRNDPGDSQTVGGKHTDGSEHYKGRAIDFGNARNTTQQLNAWKAWAKSQGLDVLDEGDHVHVSLPGGGI